MTACAPTSSGIGLSTISNATSICVETMSSYSISASASAVFSTGDHITGLAPRYSWPLSANLNSSETIVASAPLAIVRYGLSQFALTPSRFRFPPREDRRLLLRQPGLHRKVGARKEDGRAVVGLGGVGSVGHGCGRL